MCDVNNSFCTTIGCGTEFGDVPEFMIAYTGFLNDDPAQPCTAYEVCGCTY